MKRLEQDHLPACDMVRVVLHWTAGTHKASALYKEHYHVLVEGDGTIVYGNPYCSWSPWAKYSGASFWKP